MTEFVTVPSKKSTDVDLVKPLKLFISSYYNTSDNTDAYNEPIESLNKLRISAVSKYDGSTEATCSVLSSYYDELTALDEKLKGATPQITFKWKDSFDRGTIFAGRASLSLQSLKFERICLLYNIAAVHSSIAATQLLDADEGLKTAAKLFQSAAGLFKHIKEEEISSLQYELTSDLNPEVLSLLTYLMLAQAQEVFILKAIRDKMKDAILAKLCAQCEDFYSEAAKIMQKQSIKNLIGSWGSMVPAKQQIFRGLSEYFQSVVCNSMKEIGEEIARLQVAVESMKNGLQQLSKTSYNDYLNKASRALALAEKDNNFIYHERVPDVSSLNPIARAAVAKPTVKPAILSTGFKDLFSTLTPVAVRQALASYDVRKTELINTEVNKLRESTQLLNNVLATLNLPAALEDTNGISVPPSLLEKSYSVISDGGIAKITQRIQELPELLKRNQQLIDETERMILEEKQIDDQMRAQYKEKWTVEESSKLTTSLFSNIEAYRNMIKIAMNADNVVRDKLNKNKRAIELLSSGKEAIESAIPVGGSSSGTDFNTSTVNILKQLMEEVETIKAERDAIESELKTASTDMKVVFLAALSQDEPLNEEQLSTANLKEVYGPLQKQVEQSLKKQEKLLADIQTNNMEFSKQKNDSVGSIHRENFLKELAAGYDAYNEINKNLEEGIKFYNDLTQHVVTFQNKASDYCFARKTKQEEMVKALSAVKTAVSTSSSTSSTSTTERKKDPPARPPAPNVYYATLPYPLHNQVMPMPIPPSQPMYGQPMPTTYNPYATLPQMHAYPQYQNPYPTQGYQYPYYPPQQHQ